MHRGLCLLGGAVIACGTSPVTPPGPDPGTLTLLSGGQQVQVAGYQLADTVVVALRDGDDLPIPFAPIAASTAAVLGRVTVIDPLTRTDGTARLVWRLGLQLDGQELVVTSGGGHDVAPLNIAATATGNRLRSLTGSDELFCAIDAAGGLGCVAPVLHPDVPPRWSPVSGGPFAAVAVNHLTSGVRRGCAATVAGPVRCFDVADDGTIGVMEDLAGEHPPLVSLSTSTGQHEREPPFCGLAADGSAWCWGDNRHGVLSDGTLLSRNVIAAAAAPLRFATLVVGAYHACGTDLDGSPWCWGRNDFSQLGAPPTALPMTQPVRRTSLLRFHAVLPIREHATCALARENAGVWCWGEKTSLGIGALIMGLIDGPSTWLPVFVSELSSPAAIGVVGRATVTLAPEGRHAWWGRLDPGVDLVEALAPRPFLPWVPMASLAVPVAEGMVCGPPPGRVEVLCLRVLSAAGYATHQAAPHLAGFGMPLP